MTYLKSVEAQGIDPILVDFHSFPLGFCATAFAAFSAAAIAVHR